MSSPRVTPKRTQPARGPSERGALAREKLLNAAVELTAERGWNGVSTRILAQRAGIAPGLVHYHFESVHALQREAITDVLRNSLSSVVPVLEAAADARAGVRAMLDALEVYSGKDPISLAVVEAYLAATRDEVLFRELSTLVREFRDHVAGWLARHGHDLPVQTAAVLAAAIDGVLIHRAFNSDLHADALMPVLSKLLT
jgi:AcrR family transcriptional regulator